MCRMATNMGLGIHTSFAIDHAWVGAQSGKAKDYKIVMHGLEPSQVKPKTIKLSYMGWSPVR